jgi:hypothetical protein
VQPPQFKFYDAQKPIYTSPRFLPPTAIEKCSIKKSIISHGCFLRECKVEHSIVGIRARLEKGADLKVRQERGMRCFEITRALRPQVLRYQRGCTKLWHLIQPALSLKEETPGSRLLSFV